MEKIVKLAVFKGLHSVKRLGNIEVVSAHDGFLDYYESEANVVLTNLNAVNPEVAKLAIVDTRVENTLIDKLNSKDAEIALLQKQLKALQEAKNEVENKDNVKKAGRPAKVTALNAVADEVNDIAVVSE